MAGDKLERLAPAWAWATRRLRDRARAGVVAAPGRRPAERVPGGRRLGRAADDRLRRAERGGRPDGGGGAARGGHAGRHRARRGEAARRRVQRDDPGRGRGRHRRATTPGSWCSTAASLPGEPLADHLPIADEVLELEVTPNRPDVMGVYGVARDLHAVTGAPLARGPDGRRTREPSGNDSAEDHVQIEIDPEICLRFTARVFEDVTSGRRRSGSSSADRRPASGRSRTSWTSPTT